MKLKEQEKKKKKQDRQERKKIIWSPYPTSTEITDRIQEIRRKHHTNTPINAQKILLHPKDKIVNEQKSGVIYKLPCISCNKTDMEKWTKHSTDERMNIKRNVKENHSQTHKSNKSESRTS